MTPPDREVDVLVVGAGPTGLTLAALLAADGTRVHVVEAAADTVDEPRAIALADESLRTAHRLGLVDALRPDLVWVSGSRYYGARGQLLVRTQPAAMRQGFPVKTLFDQPGYVRVHRRAVEDAPAASLEFGCAAIALAQDADGVDVTLESPSGVRTLRARYVVGCDGGKSLVRTSLGVRMTGSSQKHPWIVLDVVDDPRDHGDTEFHCDPRRPHVVVPGSGGRCRYEFMLLPGERAEEVLQPDFVAALLAPFRTVRPDQVRRAAVYVAHQLVAERWRVGRLFLAGDAAHLMPPFAGQGLNTGIRDVRNLSWKLSAVLAGRATDGLLDSYETERRPHASAMVRFSYRLGALVMTSRPRRAAARDLVLRALRLVPPVHRHVTELRFVPRPDVSRGVAVPAVGPAEGSFVGAPLPQGPVIDEAGAIGLLDDALGTGWALVVLTDTQSAAIPDPGHRLAERVGAGIVVVLPRGRIPRRRPGVTVVAEQHPALHLDPTPGATARYLLVRPDRYVAADFAAADAAAVADALARYYPAPTSRALDDRPVVV
ncbi:bifunctional 3-(3-hydroxy-phenyl)propionate/3-hydroxycinnamic acid hydroxylase [Pseudonocardia sp. WMMC193]|uniref:bifunctional 3-(3-hydroxy-phenyl)propionate/3-hydroxycinnamic acid hydroxylase n=1 Tax=Pseudonocardia sp. WMMC193 TaxID=2911965 RepID=UPI001F01E966|nr:bifunctional 3-(3-hydroxy-phenyl)propionate/3-hydroxycinnamic acid hydroxylase [Pseudonocardia sp. WMMC193]MCF7547925.1 bifunctional 3-(3-hydroxy-phenyl)propionate/3-hydroxycinnamic acid hydroxylase [Pseudonocardia sp. WMMC193]